MHIYSDASEKAISTVAYIVAYKVVDSNGDSHVGFVLGNSKVAPKPGHTIPCLLCVAVLAMEIGEIISEEMDIIPSDIRFYTDTKVVLGYMCTFEMKRDASLSMLPTGWLEFGSSPHQSSSLSYLQKEIQQTMVQDRLQPTFYMIVLG